MTSTYASSNIAAAKRLRKELQNLERSSQSKHSSDEAVENDDVYLRPTRSDNILHWTALLKGPVDTPYQGGVFQLSITCSPDYPLAPPKIQFITKIFHPNVHFSTGDVCLDILQQEWSPAWGLQAACRAVVALLSDPDASSPLNCDAGNMVRDHADDLAFFSTARLFTVEHAMFLKWPTSSSPSQQQQETS